MTLPPCSFSVPRRTAWFSRGGSVALALLGCSLLLAACGRDNPGAKLEREVGDPANDSAAVDNHPLPDAVPPDGKGAPPAIPSPGVQRGFGDASGGHSLTGHAPNGYPASLTPAAEAASPPSDARASADPVRPSGRDLAPSTPADLVQRVRERLAESQVAEFLPIIEVQTDGTEVTLRGRVPDRELASAVERTVQGVPGVEAVHNELAIESASAAAPAE